ncbi:MAG TPA: sulfurtransferase, partial [Methanotrichaceae archaeon]|nr:sulfurtransferase [Methanotrichaceae archaeon]
MRNYGRLLSGLGMLLVIAAALVGGAYAGCSSCTNTKSEGTWMGPSSLGLSSYEATSSVEKTSENGADQAADLSQASSVITARALFEDQEGDSKRVMAYVGVPGDESYIEGSIHLPLDQVFNEDGSVKSPAEIAALFGAAGISENDPLVIYGDSFVNGYDTFAFWVMKYMGHKDVVLLEGTKGGREAAGLKFVATPTPKAPETYNPDPNLDLLASNDQLESAQVVDARSPAEYAAGHLEGAVNIDYS